MSRSKRVTIKQSEPTRKARSKLSDVINHDDSDSISEENSNEDIFVASVEEGPRVKRSKKNEYEEDPGRVAGQEFLSVVRAARSRKIAAKKKDTDQVKGYKANLQAQEAELSRFIEENQATSTTCDSAFFDTFRAVYGTAILNMSVNELDNQAFDLRQDTFLSEIRQNSSKSLMSAYKLIEDFEKSDKKLRAEGKILSTKSFESDFEGIQRMLDAGQKVGEKKVDHLIRGTTQNIVTADAIDANATFFSDTEKSKGSTWATVARHEKKAMRNVVRIIQTEIA